MAAYMLGVRTEHSLIFLDTQLFSLTIDYYSGSKIFIRAGSRKKVLEGSKSREESTIREVSGKKLVVEYEESRKDYCSVGDIIKLVEKTKPEKQYNTISNNCHSFAEKFWNELMEVFKQEEFMI